MSDYYPKCAPDVNCPHCNPRPPRMSESSFAAPTLLGALVQATKDFDMEEWKDQDSSCLLCHAAMGLDDGCEWPDDPRLLLCWSCMSNVMGELLAVMEAPNAEVSQAAGLTTGNLKT